MVKINQVTPSQKSIKCDNVELYTFYDGAYAEIIVDNEVVGKIWGEENLKKLKKVLNSLDK